MTWAYDATQTRFDNINLSRPGTTHSSLIRCSLEEHTRSEIPKKNAWIQAPETLHYCSDSTLANLHSIFYSNLSIELVKKITNKVRLNIVSFINLCFVCLDFGSFLALTIQLMAIHQMSQPQLGVNIPPQPKAYQIC